MTLTTTKPMHPAYQMIILLLICMVCMLAGTAIAIGLVYAIYGYQTLLAVINFTPGAPGFLTSVWLIQILGMTVPLFMTSIIFTKMILKKRLRYLKAGRQFFKQERNTSIMLLIIVFVLMFSSSGVMEYLVMINQKMHLPSFLKGVEDWMRQSEDAAGKETNVLLSMKTPQNMLFDLLEVGLLTAIAEEFLFRGCMQNIFTQWTKDPHTAIWITAILFSTFHMQFFGFLPRLMLGVLFGYFVFWSNSIWTSVWAHFINNGTAVIATYLYQQKVIKLNPDDMQTLNTNQYTMSLLFTVLLLATYRYIAINRLNGIR